MDGVWYVVSFIAVIVGVMGRKYLWSSSSSKPSKKVSAGSSSSNTYPEAGDLMTEVNDKWRRPLPSLPVHVDIPRLARKISIYTSTSPSPSNNNDKQPILLIREDGLDSSKADQTNDNLVIKELIRTLSQQLGEPATQQENIDSHFMEYFRRTADPSQALADFLREIVGLTSHTASVLKACNQSVLAPGVLQLKYAIGNHYPYKDARGSWRIEIVFGPDWVTVEHIKSEKSFDDSPQHYFEFSWSLRLTFDKDIQVLREVGIKIDDTVLPDSMSSHTRKKVYEVLKPFLRNPKNL